MLDKGDIRRTKVPCLDNISNALTTCFILTRIHPISHGSRL
jgi:hypothetical protein